MQKLVQPQPQPQPGLAGAGGPSQPAVGPSPIATILQTSPSSIATTVPLALWFELAPLREAPFWRQPEVPRAPLQPLTAPHSPLQPLRPLRGALRGAARPLTAPCNPKRP